MTLNDVADVGDLQRGTARVRVHLSWDGGTNWTTATTETPNLGTNTTAATTSLGSQTSMTAWTEVGRHWVRVIDLANGNFVVRLTSMEGAGCASTSRCVVDEVMVRVYYNLQTVTTTTTTTTLQQNNVTGPGGQALTPQKFWGAMQSQGAPSIQGDAYMTKYETRKSVANGLDSTNPDANYAWQDFYNYAVEIPAGSSNGAIYVYDAGFCDGTTAAGTGENWTVGGTERQLDPPARQRVLRRVRHPARPCSTTRTTRSSAAAAPPTDGCRIRTTRSMACSARRRPSGIGDCDAQGWHLGWTQIASGLTAGTYRIHSYSTDATALSDQDDSTGLNAFAFYANATGGTPRIYGLGAMEAYVRLPGGQASEFYLAQIDAVHAGKTMVINLWDPGDTGALSARPRDPPADGLRVLARDIRLPGHRRHDGAARHPAAGRSPGSNVTAVTTNTGGSSLLQRLLADDRDPPADDVQRTDRPGVRRGRLVEDPLHDGR